VILSLQVALRYVIARKRAMGMSLLGIVFGIAFFVVTQAQTSGFETFFIRTILGTNGAIRVSDRFQDVDGTVTKVSDDGRVRFVFRSREGARYVEGIEYPEELRKATAEFTGVTGVSEILEGAGVLDTGSRSHSVRIHGIRASDHIAVSDLEDQVIRGRIKDFRDDRQGILVGNRIAERLRLEPGDRVILAGSHESLHLRVAGIFETGVSQIDKSRIYLDLSTARSFLRKPHGGSVFQVGIREPEDAPAVAAQMQETFAHRVVSWQEREKVWLDVFKALRVSSAITVSTIILLSGLGMFNVFAIMVIEKTRDVAILRSMGFTPGDVSRIFLWQGALVLALGIVLGCLLAAAATFGISRIPLRIRGVFSTDSFVVNWDISHYLWAVAIAIVVVGIASWIPARRAARIEPAKIIRETL
jgi:lipoprotein-releasing system permease protein